MLNVNEHLKKSVLRVEQLKNQKKLREQREQEARRKMDTRRAIIIGELVCKYFPDVKRYQPGKSTADTTKVFADFEGILCRLAANAELLAQLKYEAAKMTSGG